MNWLFHVRHHDSLVRFQLNHGVPFQKMRRRKKTTGAHSDFGLLTSARCSSAFSQVNTGGTSSWK
jgi:hypothetical protein